ncbi:MAG TPA: serine hydrolase, partial [Chitinophagaceae bacterium]|nr:serine hydrolase [Chitinophagaceae bacterium]
NEPSGDINIRLKDYIKYIQLHLQGLSGKSQYLKASTLRFLLQGIPEYSLGWYNVYENGKHWISHSGTDGTYYAVTHIDRERKTAYIVFTNCFTEDTQKGVRALMRKLKQKQEN